MKTRPFLFVVILCSLTSAAAAEVPALDADRVTTAIVRIRSALPYGWEETEIRWDGKPAGWSGSAECVLVRVEDMTPRHLSPNPLNEVEDPDRPTYEFWFLSPFWEGRMEVAPIQHDLRNAVYLGANDDYRVLYQRSGRNTWPGALEALTATLELESFPLTQRPRHSLDVRAMQRLFQRLDVTGYLQRFQEQIYGIQELPDLIYLELLTWEGRENDEAEDPTYLGSIAEVETRYLSREVLAAFPRKKSLYLRRVTESTFSDVLVANPTCLAPTQSE